MQKTKEKIYVGANCVRLLAKNTGITLVALIITIIVLLILAGVAISALAGDNGLIEKAKQVAGEYKNASGEEVNDVNGIFDRLSGGAIGEYNETKGVNKPLLSEGMIPVKYNGTNWEICSQTDNNWYNYQEKKYANIMLSDGKYNTSTEIGTEITSENDLGSMFVWIPRYAYSIKEYKTEKRIK